MANQGHAAFFPALETELLGWVSDRGQQGFGESTAELRLQAFKLAKKDPTAQNFKASVDWCYALMKHHSLSIRRCTQISQNSQRIMKTS